MADPQLTDQQIKDTKELGKLYKEQPKLLRGISGIWDSISLSIAQSAETSTKLGKANEKFLGISRSVLKNTKHLHEESVTWLDINKKINKALKKGDTQLAQRYKHMQKIQNSQKRYNNVVNAGATSLSKMVSSLESTIRGLPIIGDFIADAVNFDDIGKNMTRSFRNQFAMGGPAGKAVSDGFGASLAQGSTEGIASGVLQAVNDTKTANPLKVWGAKLKGFFGKQKMFANWNDFQKSFKGSGASIQATAKEWKEWGKNATVASRAAGSGLANIGKLLGKGGLIGLIAVGVALLGAMVASSAQFAFQTGLSLGKAKELGPALLINKKYVEAMAEEFGTINDVNARIAGKLKFQELKYGIQSDQAVKILRIQTAISGQTSEQLINIQSTTANLARQAGVLPAKLFEDIAQNMEYFAKSAKEGGLNVMKTATAAAKLGLNLGVVDQIATHLLDIEGSINAQFEANAVLGKNMNFDRARSLVLAGKDHLLLAEIKKQVGGEAEFNKMNRIERELLSKAIGTDVINLAKIATDQEKSAAQAQKGMNSATKWWMGIGAVLLGALAVMFLPFTGLAAGIGVAALGALGGATLGGLAGATVGSSPAISKTPKLATGGVIVGDRGPELISPYPPAGAKVDFDPLIAEIRGMRKDFNSGQGKTNRYLSDLG